MATLVHGTCVELSGIGVLLRGASGSGKSDLALRLIDGGGFLVSDDQVAVECVADHLVAQAPTELSGMFEVRGVGVVRLPFAERAFLGVTVDLVERNKIERLPTPQIWEFLGVKVPLYEVDPFTVSAADRVRLIARLATNAMAKS